MVAILACSAASLVSGAAAPARAAEPAAPTTLAPEPEPARHVPMAEARLGLMLGIPRLDTGLSLLTHRLRGELGAVLLSQGGYLIEPGVAVRVAGPPHAALWIRGGYQRQKTKITCPEAVVDGAHALDAGLAFRYRWRGGSLVAVEGGLERVLRDQSLTCGDSSLGADAMGGRVVLLGQWAFFAPFGMFMRAGLRTGDHLPRIHMLPELFVGVSYDH